MLIAREKEKTLLQSTLNSEYSDFVAVYGRRRVGKTFLIRDSFDYSFTFQHAGLANGTRIQQLEAFANSLKEYGVDNPETPLNWMHAFEMLKDLVRSSAASKKVIFLDELSWMNTRKCDLMVALEGFWNGWASARKDVVLVVCASATSWMLDNVIHNKGGLYNRLTREIKLEPFHLYECKEFMAAKNVVMNDHELLEGYMIMGGIPYYWSFVNKRLSLSQNIDMMFFNRKAPLRNEYEYLYASIFDNPEKYIKVIEALGRNKDGLTRNDVSKETKIPSSGNLTKLLENLVNCGFIKGYVDYGMTERNQRFKLIDNFTIFYFKFMKRIPTDEHYWTNQVNTSARNAWCGLAFERVCMEHIPQIKRKLGITGVLTEEYTWHCTSDPDNGVFGSQIDLILDRRDQVINLCEMKYSRDEFSINRKIDTELRHKISDLNTVTKTKSAIHLTIITTYGLVSNSYSGSVQNLITARDLIKAIES